MCRQAVAGRLRERAGEPTVRVDDAGNVVATLEGSAGASLTTSAGAALVVGKPEGGQGLIAWDARSGAVAWRVPGYCRVGGELRALAACGAPR